MTCFRYDAAILQAYPQLVGGILVARGLKNGSASPALQAIYAHE